ncbi:MAG TPA: DUF4129 domain-containing protein [Acidimicrobiales bacterium]
MTGSNDRSWNSLDRVVAPALAASIEAAWVSIWIAALWRTPDGQRVDVPFLTLAITATAAIGLTSYAGVLVGSDRLRRLLRVAVGLVVGAIAAGVLGVVYLHGTFLAFGFHPWTVPSGAASSDAAACWFAAAIAVARGSWLGSGELGRRQVVNSLVVATIAFVVFFFAAVIHRGEAAFSGEVRAAEVLLLVSFPCAIALLAVVSERELERSSLRERLSRPSVAWLGAVLVPMAGVGAIALGVALSVRPLIPLVADGVRAVALFVVDVLDHVLSWLASLVHLSAHVPKHVVSGSGGGSRFHEVPGKTPVWITVVAVVLAVVLAVALVTLVFRAVRQFLRQRRPQRAQPALVQEEERDSLFSWSHLLDQLLAVLRRWRGGRAASDLDAASELLADLASGEDLPSVRSSYRRVLQAARSTGHPRRAFETPLELDSRLAPLTNDVASRALSSLTNLYDVVRYGGHLETSDEVASAGADADMFVAALHLSGDDDLVGN